ncbi:MAG: hypothetical protein IT497_06310 [Ottowia sp.]|nr:hypothetical protein [Ottowia sp.]
MYAYRYAHIVLWLSLLGCAALLTSCGFKLRGAENLIFKHIYIKGDTSMPLNVVLRRAIRGGSNAQLVEDMAQADAVLEIIADTRDRLVVSVNPQGQVREYRLTLQTTFSLKDCQGNMLVPPTDISLWRALTYSQSAVLAKEVEANALYDNMEEDIARQIMRRLAAIKTLTPKILAPTPVVPTTPSQEPALPLSDDKAVPLPVQ